MDIRQLKYFLAVAEELHFGRAAARLHLSQPPLTRQIQLLEEEIGALLFTRTPKGVLLTQAGETLRHDAASIVALLKQAAERARLAGQGRTGILDIGVYGSSALNIVPSILAFFAQTHPDVQIRLHNAHRTQQIEALRQRRVLIAFDRYLPDEEDLEAELVARESLLVALKRSHPLASKESISICELKSEAMVMPSGLNSRTANAALNLCQAHGFEPRIAYEATDVVTGIAAIASGQDGVALVPQSATAFRLPELVFRPLQEAGEAMMELHCLYLKADQPPLLRELLIAIRNWRSSLTGPAKSQLVDFKQPS